MKIAIVTQDFGYPGGVGEIVKNLYDQLKIKNNIKIISIPTKKNDNLSINLFNKLNWGWNKINNEEREFEGYIYRHFGCIFSEIEFMRYIPTVSLKKYINEFDKIIAVCGTPAGGLPIILSSKSLYLQFATLTKFDRYITKKPGLKGLIIYTIRRINIKITELIDVYVIKKSEMIFTENKQMYDYCKSISKAKVIMWYPGVEVKKEVATFKKNKILINKNNLIIVGRLNDDRKNLILLPTILKEIKELNNTIYDSIEVKLVGRTPPNEKFWDLVKGNDLLDKVKYLGNLDKETLIENLTNSKISLLLSKQEGFGMVIIESMAMGIPVIASRCTGPEEIISNGIDGILVEIDDAKGYAEAIIRLCSNNNIYEQMRIKAIDKIKNKFNNEINCNNLLKNINNE